MPKRLTTIRVNRAAVFSDDPTMPQTVQFRFLAATMSPLELRAWAYLFSTVTSPRGAPVPFADARKAGIPPAVMHSALEKLAFAGAVWVSRPVRGLVSFHETGCAVEVEPSRQEIAAPRPGFAARRRSELKIAKEAPHGPA